MKSSIMSIDESSRTHARREPKIQIGQSNARREIGHVVSGTWMKVRPDLWISLSGLEYITRRRWRKKNEENASHLFLDWLELAEANY